MITTRRYTVKPVDENELDSVLEVYRSSEEFLALGPQPRASLEMIRSDMELSKTECGTYCGIWDSECRMIGIVDFVADCFDGVRGHGFLSLLMISASRRGLGIGTEIVTAIEQEIAREYGVTTILSAVQTNNYPAIRFWRKMGYRIVSGPEPQQDGTVTYRLSKSLPNREA